MGQPDRVHGPCIPERSSVRIASASSPVKEGKRRSLPASPQQHESRRRPSNRVAIKPASPEVISSLIDTLSAISSPAESHLDNLPHITDSQSTPASPSAWNFAFPPSGSSNLAPPLLTTHGLGIDRNSTARSSISSHKSHLHPGYPPEASTRRSSRPIGSEASSHTKTREAAYEDLLDDAYSIGTPSIEPGVAPEPSPKRSSRKKSLRSLASARSLKSLRLKPSIDSLPSSDLAVYPIKRQSDLPKRERVFIGESRSPSSSPKALILKRQDDGPNAFDLLHSPDHILPVQPSPTTSRRLWLDSDKASSSAGPSPSRRSSYQIPSYDHIPRRDSSQRHSPSLASQKRRSRAAQSERSSVRQESEAKAGEDQFHTPPQTPPVGTGAEFDQASVNRRIEELKEQKAKRELEKAELSVSSLDLPARGGSRSPSPSLLKPKHTMDQLSPTAPTPNATIRLVEEQPVHLETEDFAPPPAIRSVPLRTDPNTETRINSLGGNPIITKHSPASSRDDTKSANPHQRSNSRILRRLSQHAGSPTAEKHKRRSSNPLGYTPVRRPSYITNGGDTINDAVSDYLTDIRLSQKIVHPQTGRVISFSQVGDPNGSVVFCCVGMGLTRYITAFYDELATTLKLRLITPDRPGVGGSEPHADGKDTPLGWPDDVRTICEQRGITKFSILAHSAGAIYALATALRMPQHIRCRVHLLAPWIPPSQMSAIGTHQEPLPATAMPYSQRFLRSLPTTFLRAANSSFLNFTSNSITTSLPRSPKRSKKGLSRSATPTPTDILNDNNAELPTTRPFSRRNKADSPKQSSDKENRPPSQARSSNGFLNNSNDLRPSSNSLSQPAPLLPVSEKTRLPFPRSQTAPPASLDSTASTTKPTLSTTAESYEARLASRTWDLATTNANPSVDLLVCLERRQPIGFRYVDITRSVVIHHGSKDSRVPLDNVKWLAKMMRRCEVRVLEGEGHGLMASAGVMGGVLMEMAGEWEDWLRVVEGTRKG